MQDWPSIEVIPFDAISLEAKTLLEVKSRLETYEREVLMLSHELMKLRSALQNKETNPLSAAITNSRNWALGAVMSQCFIQSVLEANQNAIGSKISFVDRSRRHNPFTRASQVGFDDGVALRQRLNIAPRPASVMLRERNHRDLAH